MGRGAGKKLREWGRYEYGTAVGDAPGNCGGCAKFFTDQARSDADMDTFRAEQLGLELPVIQPKRVVTPCRECPKHALYPDNFGLDPDNEMAVQIYRQARQDQRVGVFDGAPLVRTVTIEGVMAVMGVYRQWFANWLHRQRTFEKVMILDAVATETRGEREEQLRSQKRAEHASARSAGGEMRR